MYRYIHYNITYDTDNIIFTWYIWIISNISSDKRLYTSRSLQGSEKPINNDIYRTGIYNLCNNNKRCMDKDVKRTECQIMTRVCGWLSPTANFNPGKKQERLDRLNFFIKEKEL